MLKKPSNSRSPVSDLRGGPSTAHLPHAGAAITDLAQVKGIKDKRSQALVAFGISSVRHLLFYCPYGYLDRSRIVPIRDLPQYTSEAQEQKAPAKRVREVTIVARVLEAEIVRTRQGKKFFRLTVDDEAGQRLECYWFNGVEFFKDVFEPGELLALSGRPAWNKKGSGVVFAHPKFDRLRSTEEGEPDWGKMFNTGRIIPKYSSAAELEGVGLDSSRLRFVIQNAFRSHAHLIEECLPSPFLERLDMPDRRTALTSIHAPESEEELKAGWKRMKFEELFFYELMVALRKKAAENLKKPHSFRTHGPLVKSLIASLPYELTEAQKRVLEQIFADLASPHIMNRLLQGDVGSGKTVVALFACLAAIDSGLQAAIMAPTEILAEQHVRSIMSLLGALPVEVRLLTAGVKTMERNRILDGLHSGTVQLVIGTHALIEEAVQFQRLGLVVVDEQHRFGVEQRAALAQKGWKTDQLVMSATPIPRSLAMTLYGDLDVSVIDEMPKGRKPVKTEIVEEARRSRLYSYIREEAAKGRQTYIVFPLIEKSEKVDLKAATVQFERLQKQVFPGIPMGLIHGRMPSADRDDTMRRFKGGTIKILVATTIIEVGIDVPNATMMVIEEAERFGLSQLHQLRGRVGRGGDQSYCVLIPNYTWFDKHVRALEDREKEKESAISRLEAMARTADGFEIAEVDLELRGQGDFFGTSQSGAVAFTFANIVEDRDLLTLARAEAFALVANDPQLRGGEHVGIRKEFEQTYAKRFSLGGIG